MATKLREAQARSAARVHRVFGGADGAELLNEMRREFPGKFHVDPTQHAFNAGQRDVITWIEEKLGFELPTEESA